MNDLVQFDPAAFAALDTEGQKKEMASVLHARTHDPVSRRKWDAMGGERKWNDLWGMGQQTASSSSNEHADVKQLTDQQLEDTMGDLVRLMHDERTVEKYKSPAVQSRIQAIDAEIAARKAARR